jgi:hypothetical protein
VFGKGEISRRVRETLRFAKEPMSAEEIARAAMVDKGLSVGDGPMRRMLKHSFLSALHRMFTVGTVQKVGHGLGARDVRGDILPGRAGGFGIGGGVTRGLVA